MKKSFTILVILVFFIVITLTPLFAKERVKLLQGFTSIGTGSVVGTYFPLGVGIAKLINSKLNSEVVTVVPTDGSIENISLINIGDVKYGFCQSDIFSYAVKGKNMFSGNPQRDLRCVVSLYPEVVQILVRSDSDIWDISDLRGKKVCVGKKLSGTKVNSEMILEYHKIPFSEIVPIYSGFSNAIEKLIEGKTDVIFITAGIPTEAVVHLIDNSPIRLISMDKETIKLICKKFPYFVPYTITANTYNGQNIKITTIATRALLIAKKSVNSKSIHNFLRIIFSNIEFLKSIHASVKDLNINNGCSGVYQKYIHDESKKFFGIKNGKKN